jgi:hypothetical protein
VATPRIPLRFRNCPIYDHARSAVPVMAEIAGVDHDRAHEMLVGLVKAGFVIAPREPSDGMLGAYVAALGKPSKHFSVIIHNLGKARRRWAAMAGVGTRMALSRHGEQTGESLETSDRD